MFNERNLIKGVLITLIVLGHNKYITNSLPGLFDLLYTFHVQAFLLLPFMVGEHKQGLLSDTKKLLNRIYRYYVPYAIFLTVVSIIYMVYIGRDIQETTELLIKALIFATPESIKVSCGYILYWFLPSLISLTLLRYLSLYRPRLILLITIFFLVSDLVGFGFLNSLKVFGINIAIYIYPLGVFLNNILRGRWLNNGVKIYLVSLYLTLGFSYAALNDVVINVTSYEFLYKESVLGFLLTVALPVMFLYLLCGVAQYIKAGRVSPVAIVFSILGKNSLIIFLLHSLVLQFVYFVFGEYLNALESWSVFVYILIFLLSLSLPVLLGKLLEGKVSAFLFPKGIPNTLLKKWL